MIRASTFRLTIIHPCIGRNEGDRSYIRTWQMEPLPAAAIAGLTPRNVKIQLYDDRMDLIPFDQPTDLVAISVETYTARRAYQIASEYRQRNIPVVMTTGGGLYRSRLHDRIRVRGKFKNTSTVEFVGKEKQVSDLYGEKLSEGFVSTVLQNLFEKYKIEPRFVLLAPECNERQTWYTLFIESTAKLPPDLDKALESLHSDNPHYKYCVALGQLSPSKVLKTKANSKKKYIDKLVQEGVKLGDLKPSQLSLRKNWSKILCGSSVVS